MKKRLKAKELWDFVNGIQKNSIPRMPLESQDHWEYRSHFVTLIFKRILDFLTTVYDNEPVRTIINKNGEIDQKMTDYFDEILWNPSNEKSLSDVLKKVDEYSTIGGQSLVMLFPNVSENGKVESVKLIPYNRKDFEFIQNDLELSSIFIYKKNETIDYWDTTTFQQFVENNLKRNEEHNLGMIPALICNNQLMFTDDDLNCGWVNSEILISFKEILRMLEQISWSGLLQRGQPVLGDGAAKNVFLAPDSAIESETFRIEKPGADLKGMLDVLQTQLDFVALGFGIPRHLLSIRNLLESNSSKAILASEIGLRKFNKSREKVVYHWENDLLQKTKSIIERIEKVSLNIGRLRVQHFSAPIPLTHSEKLNEVKFMLENQMIDRREGARLLQSFKTEKEIEKMVENAEVELEKIVREKALIAGRIEIGEKS